MMAGGASAHLALDTRSGINTIEGRRTISRKEHRMTDKDYAIDYLKQAITLIKATSATEDRQTATERIKRIEVKLQCAMSMLKTEI
jgi:hypothetical protein